MDINKLIELDQYLGKKFVVKNDVNYDLNKELIDEHNRLFIQRKLIEYKPYFDDMFKEIDPRIVLDEEQRTAILTDEDYNLIVAGAGSGKTTTMLAKIKYMVEKCGVNPKEILALSFARKNVVEFNHKINEIFNMNVDVMTFHSLGNKIIKSTEDQMIGTVSDGEKYNIITKYINEELFKDKTKLATFVKYWAYYFKGDEMMEQFTSLKDYNDYRFETLFKTIRNDLEPYIKDVEERRKKYHRTINSEYVRSNEEVVISNFLYLNGLDYEYESMYIDDNYKMPYRPDFKIMQGERIVYLEHFGINEDGTSTLYDEKTLMKYKYNMVKKEQRHSKNGTKLIKTYSTFIDGKPLVVHLEQLLKDSGFELQRRSFEEIFNRLKETGADNYFYEFIAQILEFLSRFKLNGGDTSKIYELFNQTDNWRIKQFLIVFNPIYQYYERYLKQHNKIDFETMIIKATKKMAETKESQYDFNYNYIVVDEYQDISKARYKLLKEMADFFDAQIIAVGDDWQAIYGFSGSDVSYFTNFAKLMGYAEELRITNTYRNSQELIDIASEFAQKDESLMKKHLYSSKHIDKPVVVYSYNTYLEEQKTYGRPHIVVDIIKDIIEKDPVAKILLLGRYNFDQNYLINSNLFRLKSENKLVCTSLPDVVVDYLTVHSAKGLEYDEVIIINAIDSKFGFPSKVKTDPLFEMLSDEGPRKNEEEERRLFYVALTRTKNKVYIVSPSDKPSPFVLEIAENHHVEMKDKNIEANEEITEKLICPECGSPMRKEYYSGIEGKVYRCVQDEEACGFMTNNWTNKFPIKKCDRCKDGYMLYKTTYPDGNLLIGCTNYKEDGSGCGNIWTRYQKKDNQEKLDNDIEVLEINN